MQGLRGSKGGAPLKQAPLAVGVLAAVVALALLAGIAFSFRSQLGEARDGLGAAVLPAALATLANKDRAAAGLEPLEYDEQLAEAARLKAEDMAERGYFAHVGPDGEQPWEWLDRAGFAYSYAGENLAVRFTESANVQRAWMASPTHRENIVRPEFTRVGLGTARGRYKGEETTFVVQFLARPRAGTPPQPSRVKEISSVGGLVPLLASAALAFGSADAGEIVPEAAFVAGQ